MKVIGIRYVDFPDKQDASKRVTGVTLFCSEPIERNGEGVFCDRFFLSDWLLKNRLGGQVPALGDEIEVLYNKQGKINDIRILAVK